ncbi:hypothetical protein ACFV2Q_37670 [Streptomyces sp. NPDC059650]|uniref:hypothetical protein n=1 Tax=Streptomyces sp. NPDC059650 TaxID=3346896 RepID=UPI00369056A7
MAGLAVLVFVVALTGPGGGLLLWDVREPTDDEVMGPAVWAGVRQVLRLEETERRTQWLQLPDPPGLRRPAGK